MMDPTGRAMRVQDLEECFEDYERTILETINSAIHYSEVQNPDREYLKGARKRLIERLLCLLDQ